MELLEKRVTKPKTNMNRNESAAFINQRSHNRFKAKTPDQFLLQRAWGHFVQIHLCEKHSIIGQIIDISLGGLGCRVAYEFDLVDPIVVDIVINLKSHDHGSNCFNSVSIPSIILRTVKNIDTGIATSDLGIKFMLQNDAIKSSIKKLIEEIKV